MLKPLVAPYQSPLVLLKGILILSVIRVIGSLALDCAPDKENYIRQNERLLKTIPVPPGAALIGVSSNPYKSAESALAPPAGWETVATYQTPYEMTSKEVVDFYTTAMSEDWLDITPMPYYGSFRFQRGKETVNIGVSPVHPAYPNAPGPYSIHIAVDYLGDGR